MIVPHLLNLGIGVLLRQPQARLSERKFRIIVLVAAAAQCDMLSAVWTNKPGGTGNTLKYAQKLGKEVFTIDPTPNA